jgi:hypothetical protein
MDAEAEVLPGAGSGEVSPQQDGLSQRVPAAGVDTEPGTIELAIPKLRAGSYFPSFLEHLAARGAGAGPGRRDVVPAGRLDPAGRPDAGRDGPSRSTGSRLRALRPGVDRLVGVHVLDVALGHQPQHL